MHFGVWAFFRPKVYTKPLIHGDQTMTKDQEKAMSKEQLQLFTKLTKLQKALCLGVLSGLTQRQAYKQAGGKAKTERTMDVSASEILNNPDVKVFMDSMYAPQLAEAIMTRDEAMQILSGITRAPLVGSRVRIHAVQQLGRMQGWEAAQKHDLTGHILTTEVPLTEAQKALLDKVLEDDI
jgi:hypothetical protein